MADEHTGEKTRGRLAMRRGQALTEYIIVVALVAIGSIAIVTLFGDNIRALLGTSANVLAGDDTVIEGERVAEEQTRRHLRNYSDFETP